MCLMHLKKYLFVFFTEVFKNKSSEGMIHLTWEEASVFPLNTTYRYVIVFFLKYPGYKDVKVAKQLQEVLN